MIDTEARKRMVHALERIADALEAANKADPLLAIQAALEAEGNLPKNSGKTFGRFPEQTPLTNDPNDDMPPHIKRLLGVE